MTLKNTMELIDKAHSISQVVRLSMQHEMQDGSTYRSEVASYAAKRIAALIVENGELVLKLDKSP